MTDTPEDLTLEQFRALVEMCPRTVLLHRPGPWGSTIYMRVPLGRNRPEPDWEVLLPEPPEQRKADECRPS